MYIYTRIILYIHICIERERDLFTYLCIYLFSGHRVDHPRALRQGLGLAPRSAPIEHFFQNKQQHRNPNDNPPFTHLIHISSRNRPGSPSTSLRDDRT